MKLISIVLLAIIPRIAFCQQSDSTRLVPVPKWKLDILLDSWAYDMPLCLATTVNLDSANQALRTALNAGQTLIDIRTEERDLKVNEAKAWAKLSETNKAIFEGEKKQQRKRGFREGSVLTGIAAAVIILLL